MTMLPDLTDADIKRIAPNFSRAELACKHTGQCRMHPETLRRLQALRIAFGKALSVTSGYRHPTHPVEAKKAQPGSHAMGRAVDLAVVGADADAVIRISYEEGFTGRGVAKTFLHLDDVPPRETHISRPTIWVY